MKPINIMAFLDGRPGHEKQTRGVLQALAARTPTAVVEVTLPPATVAKTVISWVTYLTGALLSGRGRPAPTLDLIVGTGRRTHLPMLRRRRRSGGRVVTCMTPDPLVRGRMDLCLVPHHDRPRRAPNVFVTIGPPGVGHDEGRHDPHRGLILVGGEDPKSHVWEPPAILAALEAIWERSPQTVWTVSSSPRTPADTVERLRRLAASRAEVEFFACEQTPAGWIEAQYAVAGTVWVTADSISMMYEALTAGCRVGVVPVRWKRPHNKFQRSIDYLQAHGLVRVYEDWLGGLPPLAGGGALDEASRCAEEILRRWWPERLR